jgi:hypothetical protein
VIQVIKPNALWCFGDVPIIFGIIIGPVMGLVGPETAELEQEMESEMLNLRFGNQDEGTAEDKEAEG